jgi:chromosome segregation ATPase
MADGKSKHPGLVKTAMDAFSKMEKGLSKTYPAQKDVGNAATAIKSAAEATEKMFRDQQGYCGELIEDYATKANETAEIEQDLEGAKGDKKAEAPLLKKHKKADGECDDLRKEYADAMEVFRAMSDSLSDLRKQVDAAMDKLEAARVGG